MNSDIDFHIRHNYPWLKLPTNIKQTLGNNEKEYNKRVSAFSIKNQLRYKGNLVRHVRKEEKKYYESLLKYSQQHLMLYPYHLSDVIVKGLRTTPFAYYIQMMTDIMSHEKSYDSLPNFTAADCLRLLGIGRNQYIDLMNQTRTSKKFFRRKPIKELLPAHPVDISVSHWWVVCAGYITEEDIKLCNSTEKLLVDSIIDSGPQVASSLDCQVILGLYRKGLIYFEMPIVDSDYIIVPPLEGFVMNRVLGDYFETLLYKVFVSVDEHTSVSELASVLQTDLQLVKNAISMYCRLGFAVKKGSETSNEESDPSWNNVQFQSRGPSYSQDMLLDWSTSIELKPSKPSDITDGSGSIECSLVELNGIDQSESGLMNVGHSKRIGFLFDSTLTAFLMMGNLSPGLKSHAVTMFEVGKLNDESMDSFITELEKVSPTGEGEAQRYFDHAVTLKNTIKFLRHNSSLGLTADASTNEGCGLDLIRCESLLGLDPATCVRVLNKNYRLLVSMAPLSNEIQPISSCTPQHFGPAIPEVNSIWFKLFIYHVTGSGPPSLLLVKGTRLFSLPGFIEDYEKVMITTWGHDPVVVATSNVLITLNDALTHSAVFVQAHGRRVEGETMNITFPLVIDSDSKSTGNFHDKSHHHPVIKKLQSELEIQKNCGFITLLNTNQGIPKHQEDKASFLASDDPKNGLTNSESAQMLVKELDSMEIMTVVRETTLNSDSSDEISWEKDWVLLDCCFGLPLFDSKINTNVCQSVLRNNLCSQNSLEELMKSSRNLSLRLLSFIKENQDLPVQSESATKGSMISNNSSNSMVAYPSHNLAFKDGQLHKWNK